LFFIVYIIESLIFDELSWFKSSKKWYT